MIVFCASIYFYVHFVENINEIVEKNNKIYPGPLKLAFRPCKHEILQASRIKLLLTYSIHFVDVNKLSMGKHRGSLLQCCNMLLSASF